MADRKFNSERPAISDGVTRPVQSFEMPMSWRVVSPGQYALCSHALLQPDGHADIGLPCCNGSFRLTLAAATAASGASCTEVAQGHAGGRWCKSALCHGRSEISDPPIAPADADLQPLMACRPWDRVRPTARRRGHRVDGHGRRAEVDRAAALCFEPRLPAAISALEHLRYWRR